ncbi:hypothetical protein B0T22DRAFT_445019 [Podospora appendiculata]|uniref:Uncharacterized protein n=1 Tax=Podospora appendiculata TaxID=314037 RepID=A0AAE0X1T3_9PEZI|nr:hypothetical protein B0T22DRAFT_445019 [Podospora appendiculata]
MEGIGDLSLRLTSGLALFFQFHVRQKQRFVPIWWKRRDQQPAPDADHDFSDLHLKPAPLRITRKSQSGTEQSSHDTIEIPQLDGVPRDLLRGNQGMVFLELSPPRRSLHPGLETIISKFENLDRIPNAETKKIHETYPDSPGCQRTELIIPKIEPKPKPVFAEGSPFRKVPRIRMPRSEYGSSSTDRSSQISPLSRSPSLAFENRRKTSKAKLASPLRTHQNTDEDGGDSETQGSRRD